jgi:hypothetical protein
MSGYKMNLTLFFYTYINPLPHGLHLFFSGEGPHSRRYGRTAALRLLVQPCDEEEDDDYYYYFCPFPSNGAPVE